VEWAANRPARMHIIGVEPRDVKDFGHLNWLKCGGIWSIFAPSGDRVVKPVRRLHTVFLMFAAALVLLPAAGRADIYRYVDEAGVVHFTNTPTTNRYAFYRKETSAVPSIGEIINRCAEQFGLEEALVRAVIKVESDFDARAVSGKGARGLMQLIPETAREMRVQDPFDPAQNIRGGSHYLRLMLDRFDGDLELALAAYNAGPNSVRSHGGIPPYTETINYVDRVKGYLDYYRRNQDTLL